MSTRPRTGLTLVAATILLSIPAAKICAQSAATESSVTLERRPVLMGTLARLEVTEKTRQDALDILAKVEAILRSAEADLSTWQSGGELDRLNRTPVGQPTKLPQPLETELSRAMECANLTEGAFDPTIGALTHAWDLRGKGRLPPQPELQAALQNTGPHLLQQSQSGWVRRSEVVVDEGGFGKGAALDRVREFLSAEMTRRVLVDLGGQLLLFDPRPTADPWSVAVADPDHRAEPVLLLNLAAGSVATSANSERSVTPSTETIGHLLDPRTGKPANDFGSITVWAGTGLEADCLATGLFVAGPEAALKLAAAHGGIEVLVIERTGEQLLARVSEGLRGRIEVISDRLSLAGETLPAVRPTADLRTAPNRLTTPE